MQNIVENEMLLRLVNRNHIGPNNKISPEAYRPRKNFKTETGFEDSVSTQLKSCHDNDEKLEVLIKKIKKNSVVYEINTNHPLESGYPPINDHDCHVGITGDMSKLNKDEETLLYLAENSTRLYPPN